MERLKELITVKSVAGSPAAGGKRLALAVATATILFAGHAPAAPEPAPDQARQVERACGTIMGLSPSTSEYVACAGSLMQSLNDAKSVASLSSDRAKCLQEGLASNTEKFGLCVVDRENAAEIGH